MPAKKITYRDTMPDQQELNGERYYVVNDGVTSYIDFAVIGTFDAYRAVFDSVLATFKPGHAAPPAVGDVAESAPATPEPPSTTMTTLSRSGFSISYPDNFKVESSSGAVQLVGPDGTSSTAISVKDASHMSLDQVAERYKKTFGSGASATVGGNAGRRYAYSPRSDVSGRIYMTVANNKVYMITQTWLKANASAYQPVFEKMIASFNAK